MMNERISRIVLDLVAHAHEEEWFEFKENWYEPHELGVYISALSNVAALLGQDYGYLVWGVNDQTHEIVGTDFDQHADYKKESLKHYLARSTTPDIGFDFHETQIQGKRVVVLEVPAAVKMPTTFDGDRYIRIGSSKERLMKYPEHESQLFYVLRNGYPTIANTESEYQDLRFNKLFLYFETKGISLNRRTFKKNLGLLTAEGKYNILAQLLSDDSHFTIRFALFAGKDKASPMYSVKEFGYTCLLYSLDQVLEYGKVLNIPQADERNRQTVRKEVPLFKAQAYEEAVINAFVHNRWLDGNAPMFTGFQDRIEILSRGSIPPRQTVEGFFAGESVPVNQALSDIFIKLHITEHTGRGIPKIVDAYGKETIRFNENSIVVTLPYQRLGAEVYGKESADGIPSVIPQVRGAIPPVEGIIPQVIPPVESEIPPVIPSVEGKIPPVEDVDSVKTSQIQNAGMTDELSVEGKILLFCAIPKGILEIATHLGYKDKKTVRKYLKPLIERGRIAMTIPESPNSNRQKYVAIK